MANGSKCVVCEKPQGRYQFICLGCVELGKKKRQDLFSKSANVRQRLLAEAVRGLIYASALDEEEMTSSQKKRLGALTASAVQGIENAMKIYMDLAEEI